MASSYTERPAERGIVYRKTMLNDSNTGGRKTEKKNLALRILSGFIPMKGDSIFEGVRKVIFTAAVISFIYFGSTVGADLYGEYKADITKDEVKKLKEIEVDEDHPVFDNIKKADAKPIRDYMGVYAENNDFVGWIRVGGDTKIDYAVVQADNNDYYLDHDFYGNSSKGGSIFADYRNEFAGGELSDNTVLYGHNIMTGNYFAELTRYYTTAQDGTLSWYKKYPVIDFDTLYDRGEWKVFACVLFNTQEKYGEVLPYYREHDFDTVDDFNKYILDIMDRSVIFTDVDLDYGDKILTLSTCYYPMTEKVSTRCVVFARKTREGESADVDTSKASYNSKELRFTEQQKRYGTNWTGRVWDTSKLLSYDEDF